jgi:tRNA wybutosine-synthesizing protein 2
MVLLPPGSFGEAWCEAVDSQQVASEHMSELWVLLLDSIGRREGKGPLTHLAVNSGIPFHRAPSPGPGSQEHSRPINEEICDSIQTASHQISDQGPDSDGDRLSGSKENILRTPSGLIMLHGDFGPALPSEAVPTVNDFEEAFWVSTKQNGITQIWAPRYTMFSRGNVKEKARLINFHNSIQTLESRSLSKEKVTNNSAVDLYAGIGYFVFSYVKMGMRRVIGWELNPWSVEGLRRGAIANGWSVKIVRSHEDLDLTEGQIVVVLEDNRKAAQRLRGPRRHKLEVIRHVNCGLLPTSEHSWETSLEILVGDGWLHLHENVGVNDVQARTAEITELFMCWLKRMQDERVAKVEHVEYVKTFAPGVWHCVFDVYISRSR